MNKPHRFQKPVGFIYKKLINKGLFLNYSSINKFKVTSILSRVAREYGHIS